VDNGRITISAAGGTSPYAYSIDGGISFLNNGGQFNTVGAGTYTPSVRDAGGCIVNGDPVTLAEPDPIIIVSATSSPTCFGINDGMVTVVAQGGTGTLTYTLNPGGLQNTTGMFSGLAINVYTVAVTDENDCGPVVSNPIEVGQATDCKLEVFNAFSPNGDGINDLWNIQGIAPYPDCIVKVFNSWGSTVFVSEPGYPEPWNGYLNNSGKILPAGTYYYVIDLGDGVTLTGTVNIIK
jgi:gliding motility-associated-like protein